MHLLHKNRPLLFRHYVKQARSIILSEKTVAPLAGVWIEITKGKVVSSLFYALHQLSGRRRCRERRGKDDVLTILCVAPLAGMWIENIIYINDYLL